MVGLGDGVMVGLGDGVKVGIGGREWCKVWRVWRGWLVQTVSSMCVSSPSSLTHLSPPLVGVWHPSALL